MKYRLWSLLLSLTVMVTVWAESSDFGFKPLRNKIRTKEDYFRLFNQWLYQDMDSVSRNIFFLELAYVMPYDHPIKALTPITNEMQYLHYQYLLMMQICQLLTQSYIDYGYMYMKEHIYFFNEEFKTNYLQGYDISEFYFTKARQYWDETIQHAKMAYETRFYKTDLLYMEDMVYRIRDGDLNYYKVIDNLMYRIERNRAEIKRRWGE
ncbi:hypothetical protein [Thermospira aquatica]|uniref:Uncharacterized protein n=1 Tax=Thermospira aquatica TaxID=2828656 RepID=A0AAX3BDN3_9SPIR|nr:hypothetical protein [Thermospira aquatica]URA10382.1 hypothetical protein KDW03_00835 [Thermospira aquatica]